MVIVKPHKNKNKDLIYLVNNKEILVVGDLIINAKDLTSIELIYFCDYLNSIK